MPTPTPPLLGLLLLLLLLPPRPPLGLLAGLPAALASHPGRGPPDHQRGSFLEEVIGAGGGGYPGLLQMVKKAPPDFDQLPLKIPVVQDDLAPGEAALMKEPQVLLPPPPPPGSPREERSPPPVMLLPGHPRRCVRLQQSCLGHRLPCCDPCATCYCRFFNANCFCKRFGGGGGGSAGSGGGSFGPGGSSSAAAAAAAAFPCGRN